MQNKALHCIFKYKYNKAENLGSLPLRYSPFYEGFCRTFCLKSSEIVPLVPSYFFRFALK